MRRSILLGIMPTIIMAGASRRSTRIVRSSALLYFGRGGGGSSAFVPVHLAGRRKLSSDAVRDIVNSNHKINHVSCINVDAHPRHHEMAVVCDDCTVHDYDDGHDIPPGENYCYLLRSLDSDHPLKTYIGYTTNPSRRLRQHNGELIRGARRTMSGRPWTYVAIISGFLDKVSAMQFEWAWQHVDRSRVFREAVGSDKDARKMKRRRGVIARLSDLRILLNECAPFNTLPLELFYLDNDYHDLFLTMIGEGGCLNVTHCLDSGMKDRMLTSDTTNQMMWTSSTSITQNSLTKRFCSFDMSRRATNQIHCNSLLKMGVRQNSNWALNAASLSNVQESISDENGFDQVVKTPSKFKAYPFTYHKELTVRIESLTNLGFGIARVELNDAVNDDAKKKWVIFVPNVIPSELVRVRIYRNFPTYSDADLLEIIEPSSDRVEPKCSLATVCGGCQYQHITIELQRKMKTMQVQELFERLGGFKTTEFPAVLDTLGTEEVFGYRSKITPHYDAPLRKGPKNMQSSPGISCEIGPIGFKEKASHRLVDVPFCHIATTSINDALVHIREEKRKEARQGLLKKPKKGATLLLRDADGVVETNHTAYVTTTVKDLVFRFQAGNFFQNNPFMLPKMVDLVVDAATKQSPSGNTMTHLIDCYCGSGLFCIGSASMFEVCVGIEVNDVAVAEARENASLNRIQNCAFVSASAEAIFQSQEPVRVMKDGEHNDEYEGLLVGDFPRESTVVVVDPPRKGCSEEFLEQLNNYKPARVVYMSCDPATQARDAKSLVSFGYEIVSIQPFDLFPQTRHIECLAVFERMC